MKTNVQIEVHQNLTWKSLKEVFKEEVLKEFKIRKIQKEQFLKNIKMDAVKARFIL